MDMDGKSREWLVPLTGVAFFVVGIISFIVQGEPKSADDPVDEIVQFYVDNKDSVMIGTFIGVGASVLLIFFANYLRKVLRDAGGEGETLSLVSFIGLVVVAVGFAIDGTIIIALAEAADDIDPTAVQALQALWDNDFVPIQLGVLTFLWATGISVARNGGVLPKPLGWAMIILAVAGMTPIGFVAAIGTALLVVALSIRLSLAARRGPSAPAPAA
jgi:hypothetical protein